MKYNLKKIKQQGYVKPKSLNDIKNLFVALNADVETGNGFTSYTLESKNFKAVHTDLSKFEVKKESNEN